MVNLANYNVLETDRYENIKLEERIIAKIACWGKELMGLEDLKFYLNWLKDQLRLPVSFFHRSDQ
jgi:hypothetical protein